MKDPGEQNDLSQSQPDTAASLRKALQKKLKTVHARFPERIEGDER
jgi:hypothetical protein